MLLHLGYASFENGAAKAMTIFTMALVKSNLVIPFNTLLLVIYNNWFRPVYPPLIMLLHLGYTSFENGAAKATTIYNGLHQI